MKDIYCTRITECPYHIKKTCSGQIRFSTTDNVGSYNFVRTDQASDESCDVTTALTLQSRQAAALETLAINLPGASQ